MARLPDHPVLAAVAKNLAHRGWGGYIADHEMRVVWISEDFDAALGATDGERWYGAHVAEFTLSKEAMSRATERSVMRAGLELLPALIDHTPGGRDAMRRILTSILGAEAAAIVDQVPDHQDPLWVSSVKWTATDGMSPVLTSVLATEIHDRTRAFLGTAFIFGTGLPFRLVSALARGDADALERMARLAKPGRHAAAILFADLQSSGMLSRRLPSAIYFRVVRSLVTTIDDVVVSHKGVVGRHAGDGVTAFFLVDDLDSATGAARAAIESALEIRNVVRDVGENLQAETDGMVTLADFPINVGLHWGGSLYMGQLTGGRLEITALGDEVNECARIQETAREGAILASKTLIENLSGEDAAALDLDLDRLSYATIATIEGASQKAVRDAGGIAVTTL